LAIGMIPTCTRYDIINMACGYQCFLFTVIDWRWVLIKWVVSEMKMFADFFTPLIKDNEDVHPHKIKQKAFRI